ncbi:MAG: effector binding domain-containing protein, partial [Prolixibacteraceae bacterium]|nr:effector binding domain-containing protein [Prolixibacteraceae bacterium]
LYHFIRLFQSITGYSPKNYIQQRKLSEAAVELRDTNKKITDIAYDYQFGSPESFTRAFRKHFNINPTEVRKGYSLTNLPLVKAITSEYIYQSEILRNEPPQLIELAARLLVGTSFFIHNDTKIQDLSREWGLFKNEVHTIKNAIKPERFYQVQYWSDIQDLDGMYFFTGVEVSKLEDINPLFVVKTIPPGKYLRFIHKGLANKVGYTYKYIYNQFLPNTDYILNKPFNFEYYGEKCLGPNNENSESEIYIPVG